MESARASWCASSETGGNAFLSTGFAKGFTRWGMTTNPSQDKHASAIRFVLNGREIVAGDVPPDLTVLHWLRERARLTGTKEGCAEGDCGACTVVIAMPDGQGGLKRRTENSCIRLVPQMHGLAIETIEHLGAGREDGLHPIQRELIDRHASQCGFCTPGIAMQLYGAHENGALGSREAVTDALSGNLCRCTGYGPIVDAGEAIGRTLPLGRADDETVAAKLDAIRAAGSLRYEHEGRSFAQPRDEDELASLLEANPDARLIAGGTDVGLWVAKLHRRMDHFIEVGRVESADRVEPIIDGVRVGMAATHRAFHHAVRGWHPDLDTLMRRFAGAQTRNVGTVCGNVANGSPIGDLNPTLIALGARVNLRRGDRRRSVPIEDFFIEYGRQDREPGEFVQSIDVGELRAGDLFHCSKLSKRIESDISAVLGAFRLRMDGERIAEARLAFGGMAGTAKRASNAERAMIGQRFDEGTVEDAAQALAKDFTPLTDMRASAEYRLEAAGNLLHRFLNETRGGRRLRDLGAVEPETTAESGTAEAA